MLFLVLLFGVNTYDIDVEKVQDGDTITATIHLGFNVSLSKQKIRVKNYDAYEATRARQTVEITEEELRLGREATEVLKRMIRDAKKIQVEEGKKGPYDRWELYILIDGRDLGTTMKELGYDRNGR